MPTARSHIRTHVTWIAMMDLACLILSALAAVAVRFHHQPVATTYITDNLQGLLLLFGGILGANYLAGSYRLQFTFSRFNLVVTWAFSMLFALLILSITSYAWMMENVLGRGVLALILTFYSVLSLVLKMTLYRYLFRSTMFTCRAVVLGTGARAAALRRIVENDYVLPIHKVVANIRVADIEPGDPPTDSVQDGVAVLTGSISNLDVLIRSLGVSLIIVGSEDSANASRLYPQLKRLRFEGIEVLSPLSVYEIYRGMRPLEYIDEEILMQASLESSLPVVRRLKRVMDILAAITALMLLLPMFVVIAILQKAAAPRHPVFYLQTRVGQFGKRFKIIKFRTMRPEAEQESGPVWASADDVRITPIGRILRRFRLDEMPQFLNILMGEMSLVGPRPERPEIIRELEENIPFFSEREMIPPGLTGWAQIRYPYGSTIDDARRKLEFDLYYMKHLSLSLDLQIILSTIRIVVLGKERAV